MSTPERSWCNSDYVVVALVGLVGAGAFVGLTAAVASLLDLEVWLPPGAVRQRVILGLIVTVPLWVLCVVLAWSTEHTERWNWCAGVGLISGLLLISWVVGGWVGIVSCLAALPVAYGTWRGGLWIREWYANRPIPLMSVPVTPAPRSVPRSVRQPPREVKCPYCAETIQSNAAKCKHCGEWLDSSRHDAPTAPSLHPPRTDVPGVISVIFGCLAVFCLVGGCFTCGISTLVATPLAAIGAFLGLFGNGNLRVAGLVLNILALLPAMFTAATTFMVAASLR